MKKDVLDGSENRRPGNFSVEGQGSCGPSAKRSAFLNGIARVIEAMKPKRVLIYRKKRTNKDGSSVEVELTYRDDSG